MPCEAFIGRVIMHSAASSSSFCTPDNRSSTTARLPAPALCTVRCSLDRRLSTLTSGIWLAQTARLSMAAFQLGSLVSTAVVQPLYTPETFASITPPLLAILQAVGFTNVGLFLAIRAARERKDECYLANALTMAATGLVYLVFPVKPPHINIPFVSTLLAVAAVNTSNLSRKPESSTQQSELTDGQNPTSMSHSAYRLVQFTKVITGVGALVFGCALLPTFTTSMIGQVYLLQVALNLLVSAALAVQSRVTLTADAVVLAGAAACLSQSSTVLGLSSGIGAAVGITTILATVLGDRKRTG